MNTVHEKRAHFRVDERLFFQLFKIEHPDDMASALPSEEQALYLYYQQTKTIELRLMKLLERDPSDKQQQIIALMNEKIDIGLHALLSRAEDKKDYINLSIGGAGFFHKQALYPNECYLLKLICPPEMKLLFIPAQVVTSMPYSNQNGYRISMAFSRLSEFEEAVLGKTINHIQTKQIAKKHAESNTSS